MKKILYIFISVIIMACNIPTVPDGEVAGISPSTGQEIYVVSETPDPNGALTAIVLTQTSAAEATTVAGPTKTPVVLSPTYTPSPTLHLTVEGDLFAESGFVQAIMYFTLADGKDAQFSEYVEVRLQINGTTVWRGNQNSGELNSGTFPVVENDQVLIFVDEVFVDNIVVTNGSAGTNFVTYINR